MSALSAPGPRTAAYLFAAALALAIAHSVYQIPIQISDSLEVIVASAAAPSTSALFARQGAAGTLRPMRYLQARALVAAASATGGSLHAWFRGTHAALAVMLVLLFAAAAPVRSWLDLAPFGLALTILTGMHTFTPMLREAFPVNHFLEVAVIVLFVVTRAQRAPRWLADAVIIALLAFALLLVETAVLIWIAIVACAVLRMPGIRPRTAVIATVVLVLYAGARTYFDIGAPQIGAHGSGYGAEFHSGDELRDRFGTNPLPFYGYNVVAGVLSVLFSEPQNGLYSILRSLNAGEFPPVVPIQVTSSALITLVAAGFIVFSLRQRAWSDDQRLVAAAAIVLLASGGLCLTYVKDDILSVAGVLYALTAFVTTRWLLQQCDRSGGARALVALVPVFFLVCAPLWAFRALGVHFDLRHTAYVTRNDWGRMHPAGDKANALESALTRRLQQEALRRQVTGDSFLPPRGDRYWIE